MLTQQLRIAVRPHQPEGVFRNINPARLGHMLKPACHVDHRAMGGALPRQLFLEPGNHFAGMNADANGKPLLPRQRRLHRQRRLAGEKRMGFLRKGNAEQRHHPVAQGACNGAIVTLYRLPHRGHGRAQPLHRQFGIEIGDQLCRTHDIGKQNRGQLAFAMVRGLHLAVDLGIGLTAGGTERIARIVLMTAPYARHQKRCPAGAAEAATIRILALTYGTTHLPGP